MKKFFLWHVKIWIFPIAFFLVVGSVLFFWAESRLREPGGMYDVNFMEQTFSSAQKAGDVVLFADYFKMRTAEILVQSKRDSEALLLYEFINHVFRESDPERSISDIKYAVAVYKKQLLLAMPATLKMYLAVKDNFDWAFNVSLGPEKMTDDQSRVIFLRELNQGLKRDDLMEGYKKALDQAAFFNVRALIMMKLAYLFYESDQALAKQWLDKAWRASPSDATRVALNYLEKKLENKAETIKTVASDEEFETGLLGLLKDGRFEQTKADIEKQEKLTGSLRMKEIESWLGVDQPEQEKESLPFFSVYFQALRDKKSKPIVIADELADLATKRDWSVYSSFLRYQAWGLAFFDAKDFSRAVLFKDFLKTYDPLSLFSQLESMGGAFKYTFKEYKGEELDRILNQAPQAFEKQRTGVWEGFNSRKRRMAQTIVYGGQVYVVNYDSSGMVQKMHILGMNQMESDIRPAITEAQKRESLIDTKSKKMSWIDRFFYDYMVQFVPEGIRVFKEQIIKFSSRLKQPVFTRFYSELEFKEYLLPRLESKFGQVMKGLQAKIDETGIFLYATFDFKVVTVSASGLGKLITNGESGQLILDLDHVKVNGVNLPEWVIKKVEENFNRSSSLNYSDGAEQLEILDMQYQSGGINIKCRNSAIQGSGGELVIAA